MKTIYKAALGLVLLSGTVMGVAQSERSGSSTSSVAPAPRYFQITMNLKFGQAGEQPGTVQTITTEVAVRDGRSGYCKARMMSQVPVSEGGKVKYLALGTKLDCNEVHVEGNGITLQFVMETSRIKDMVKTKASDGTEIDEPLITERTVQLAVKLPLNETKVVFDSSSHPLNPAAVKSLSGGDAGDLKSRKFSRSPTQEPPLLIEMTASELK